MTKGNDNVLGLKLTDIKNKANPIRLANGINAVIGSVIEYKKIKEQEATKRTEITEKSKVEIEKIRALKESFLSYLDHEYNERSQVYKKFFETLDKGIETGNMEVIDAAMTGILAQVKEKPLSRRELFKRNLADPNYVNEF